MPPLSPLVSLATQMHSQPGVFAVLLGSGVSTGAGLPTGWQVVKDLVRRAAVADDPSTEGPTTDEEVETWWEQNGTGDLGYSSLLEVLAPTSAGRQALLEGFFETPPDGETQPPGPSAAHRALARLVAAGAVRVILTTNFDRLMEQALLDEGIHAQVISRPEAVKGMKPLAHAQATVVKLHGDYKDLTTLNTPQELGDYPEQWQNLVGQVLDEYGLLVVGWSADWDTALVHAIEACPTRRYPLYWDARSSRGPAAQQLLTNRAGVVVPSASADDLFAELEASVSALERLSEPPVSLAIAVVRLKRYLQNPTRRIDLHDLVMSRVETIRDLVEQRGAAPLRSNEAYEARLDEYLEASMPLLTLLITGVRHDDDGRHRRLWSEVLERLLALRRTPVGEFNDLSWQAQHYPALLAFYAMGAAGVAAGDDGLFVEIGRDLTWRYPFNNAPVEPAAQVLRSDRLLGGESILAMKRWNGQRWQRPASHLLRSVLTGPLAELTVDGDTERLLDDVEYRHALLVEQLTGAWGRLSGEYRGDSWGNERLKAAGQRFRAAGARAGGSWPWSAMIGELEAALTELETSPPGSNS